MSEEKDLNTFVSEGEEPTEGEGTEEVVDEEETEEEATE